MSAARPPAWQPTRLRPAENGIRARSTRGPIGRTWWSERFVAVLESCGLASRLERGRRYARAGQVLDLEVAAGLVTALVQGSRARPYRVRLGLGAFDKAEWAHVVSRLAADASYTARLLAGEMPEDIEEAFASAGLSLFPTAAAQLSLDCSCPDMALPCKHVAAVFYLLAERFDDDPFTVLAWRGRERDDLLAHLAELRAGAGSAGRAAFAPLHECLEAFFLPAGPLPSRSGARTPPDALLDQLPAPPLAVRGLDLVEILRPAYLAGPGGK